MLSELIYVSRRSTTCTDADVAQILEASVHQNSKKDITGVLLYSKSQFIQVLEGEAAAIITLYDHIKKDPRHHQILLVSLNLIEERYFPSWQMGSKNVGENYEFLTCLSNQEQIVFKQLLKGQESSKAIKIIHKIFQD